MGSFFRECIRQFLLSLGSDQFEAIMELVKYNLFECNKVCVENNSYDDYAERVEILNSVSEDLYNKFIKILLDIWLKWMKHGNFDMVLCSMIV